MTFDGSANATGALTLTNSGVTAGTYGTATAVPQFVVDAKGRVTSVSNVTVAPAWGSITGIPTSLATGGYAANLNQHLRTTDSPTFAAVTATTFNGALNGNANTATKLQSARTISATGDGTWSVTFDGSANATGALTLASSGVTAGTYGSGAAVPQFVVDAKGRVTSASNVTVTPVWNNITSIPTAITTYAVNMNQNVRTTDSPTFAGVNTPSVTSKSNLALSAGTGGKIVANTKIQLAQQAVEEGACSEPGTIAVDANNNLFICR